MTDWVRQVALIDDGIDRANLNTYGDRVEVRGMSYWSAEIDKSLGNPSWHRSTHGHGTVMANSLVCLNPWISLHSMRIQDLKVGPGDSVTVDADSAARAIEDAITLRVDIISISWIISILATTDRESSYNQKEDAIMALRAAINHAKDRGILIFCSAPDDIKNKDADTLPYSQAKGYIFRVGAPDFYSWDDIATEDQRTIDCLVPGRVADEFDPRQPQNEVLRYDSGSSVATALAAGMASLILYMVNLTKIYYSDDPQNLERMSRYGDLLRSRDGMKRAFDNINTGNYYEERVLVLWRMFESTAEKMDNTKDVGTKWTLLDEFCTQLVA